MCKDDASFCKLSGDWLTDWLVTCFSNSCHRTQYHRPITDVSCDSEVWFRRLEQEITSNYSLHSEAPLAFAKLLFFERVIYILTTHSIAYVCCCHCAQLSCQLIKSSCEISRDVYTSLESRAADVDTDMLARYDAYMRTYVRAYARLMWYYAVIWCQGLYDKNLVSFCMCKHTYANLYFCRLVFVSDRICLWYLSRCQAPTQRNTAVTDADSPTTVCSHAVWVRTSCVMYSTQVTCD